MEKLCQLCEIRFLIKRCALFLTLPGAGDLRVCFDVLFVGIG